MNVTRQSVSKWENGESYPEMSNIFELCKVFNCKLNELIYPDMSDISSLDEEIVMNVVKFNEKKQKEVKTLSNVISMIVKIGFIVLKVAIPFIIIAMLIVPYIVSNLEVKENKITFKSGSIKIVDENKIEVHGVIIGDYDGDLADNEVIKIFKNNSNIKIISYFETAMIFLIIDIVIMIIILNYVEKLFNNIKNNQTPFTLENVGFIKKISYLMIALIFITPISDTLFSIISSVSNGWENPFEIMNILEILIIFSMSYIFEYGYEIQKDSKGKIYSEEN